MLDVTLAEKMPADPLTQSMTWTAMTDSHMNRNGSRLTFVAGLRLCTPRFASLAGPRELSVRGEVVLLRGFWLFKELG